LYRAEYLCYLCSHKPHCKIRIYVHEPSFPRRRESITYCIYQPGFPIKALGNDGVVILQVSECVSLRQPHMSSLFKRPLHCQRFKNIRRCTLKNGHPKGPVRHALAGLFWSENAGARSHFLSSCPDVKAPSLLRRGLGVVGGEAGDVSVLSLESPFSITLAPRRVAPWKIVGTSHEHRTVPTALDPGPFRG